MNNKQDEYQFLLGILTSLNNHQREECEHLIEVLKAAVYSSSVGNIALQLVALELNLKPENKND